MGTRAVKVRLMTELCGGEEVEAKTGKDDLLQWGEIVG